VTDEIPEVIKETNLDLTRLAKLLELMGSDQSGEALNAARMAHRMVKGAKKTWSEIIDPPRKKVSPNKQASDLRKGAENWRAQHRKHEEELRKEQRKASMEGVYDVLIESILMRAFTIGSEDREFIVQMNRKAAYSPEEKKRINEVYNRAFSAKGNK
jgi:hypothetical protein